MQQYKLKEISQLICRGVTPSYSENGIIMINQKCVRENRVSFDKARYTNAEKKYNKDKFVRRGDILINSTGAGTLGRVGYYDGKEECLCDSHVSILRINENVNSRYVCYYLHLNELVIESLGKGSTNQTELSAKDIGNINIPLPDIDTQNRIVDILSKYDELIEINKERVITLENTAANIYREWFVRLRFPGYKQSHKIDGIPQGWSIKRINEIAKLKAGGDRPELVSDERSELTPIPIFSNGIDNAGLYGFTDKAVIFNESITISARGTVGYAFLRKEPYVPIVRLLAVEPNKEFVSAEYLYNLFQLDRIEANGTSQQQITVPMIGKKKIIVPDKKTMEEFSRIIKPFYDEIEALKSENECLSRERKLLLPRLLSGKIVI